MNNRPSLNSHVKPGDMKYFKNVDVPLAVDKVPSSTPWR